MRRTAAALRERKRAGDGSPAPPRSIAKGMVMVAMNAADRRRRSGRGHRGAGNAPGGIASTVKEGFSGATRYLADQARSASQQVKEATSGVTQAMLQTV